MQMRRRVHSGRDEGICALDDELGAGEAQHDLRGDILRKQRDDRRK
jgi:hypothetical protein